MNEPPDPRRRTKARQWLALLGLVALVAAAWVFIDRRWAADPGLSDREYQRLWDVEHVVFELNHNVFEQMKQALVDEDGQLAQQMLSPQFQGAWPAGEPKVELENEQLRITCQRDEGQSNVVAAGEFIKSLLALKAELDQVENIRLHMHHLAPQAGAAAGGLQRWRGDADVRLTGVYGEHNAQVEIVGLFNIELEADAKAQSLPAGCVTGLAMTRIDRRVSVEPLFRDVALERGLPVGQLHDNWQPGTELATQTGGIYLADIDNDRRLDCLVTDRHRVWLLLGNAEGTFRDVSHLSPLPSGFTTTPYAAFVDLDNDGVLDLLLGSLRYRGRGDGAFEPAGKLHFEGHRGFALADFDRDGDVDVFVIRDHEPFAREPPAGEPVSWLDDRQTGGRSILLRNDAGVLVDVGGRSGILPDRRISMAAAWFDANDDGWPDLYVANDMGPNQLYMNRRDGTFDESSAAFGLQDAASSMGVVAGDIDEDGRADLYVSNMYSTAGTRIIKNAVGMHSPAVHEQLQRMAGGNSFYRQVEAGRFQEVPDAAGTAHSGWAYGANLVDIDNDGQLDLYVPAGYLSVDPHKPDG